MRGLSEIACELGFLGANTGSRVCPHVDYDRAGLQQAKETRTRPRTHQFILSHDSLPGILEGFLAIRTEGLDGSKG